MYFKFLLKYDNEEVVQCPYNRAHIVVKHRLASHLVKCRRQNLQKEFVRCPFNSSHDISASEFLSHMTICKDRKKADSFDYAVDGEPEQDGKVLYNPEVKSTEENWDEEPDVTSSYLDEKDNINIDKMVSRLPPTGMSKSERKAFYHAEAQRLEDIVEKKSH